MMGNRLFLGAHPLRVLLGFRLRQRLPALRVGPLNGTRSELACEGNEREKALEAALAVAERERDQAREALREIVHAAERLSRPGLRAGSPQEHVANVAMTRAIDAAAEIVGEKRLLDPARRERS